MPTTFFQPAKMLKKSANACVFCWPQMGARSRLFPSFVAVVFSPAGYSWNLSPPLRERLLTAMKNIAMPVMIIHAQNDYSVNPGYALDSMMNQLHKTHVLKIYPKFGNSASDGHGLIYQGTKIWEADVFKFLNEHLE